MIHTHSIDSVIQKVSSSYKSQGSDEEVFLVHRERREIIRNSLPWQNVDRYLVSFTDDAECTNFIYKLTDFISSVSIDLTIDYRVSCDRDNARAVVLALQGDSPIEELEKIIESSIDRHTAKDTHRYVSDIQFCFSSIWQMQQVLAREISDSTGLNFECRIAIAGVSNLKLFTIQNDDLKCQILDFPTNKQLDIAIDYRATCDSNNIEKTVRSLYGNFSPTETLNEEIKTWVQEFPGNNAIQVIDNFDREREKLRTHLSTRAEQTFGLNLEVRIRSNFNPVHQLPTQLKPFEPDPITVPIRVADYDRELELQLEVVLDIDLDRENEAFKNLGREFLLITTIGETVKQFFLKKIALNKFIFELQTSVLQDLKDHLNSEDSPLRSQGRKVGYLSLNSSSVEDVKTRLELEKFEFLEIKDYSISCFVKGFNQPIQVKNTLHLQIFNIQQYSIAVKTNKIPTNDLDRKPDLEKWAKQQIEKIVKPLLLQKEYVDLLPETGFEIYAREVFTQIQKSASEIGYRVTQILSIPELEKIRELEENFNIKTEQTEYPTKDASCNAKLETTVTMRLEIEDQEKIKSIAKRFKKSEISLQQQIKNKIHEAISGVMDRIEPERFFMGFTPSEATRRGEQKSVENELTEAIQTELQETFKAKIISIILKPIDTELKILFDSLRGSKNNHFQIEFQPVDAGTEKVSFTGKFQVLSVGESDWNKFQNKFKEILSESKGRLAAIAELKRERTELEKQIISDPNEIDELTEKIERLKDRACGLDEIRANVERYFSGLISKYKLNDFRHATEQDLLALSMRLNDRLQNGSDSLKNLYGLIVEVNQLICSVKESDHSQAHKSSLINSLSSVVDDLMEELDFKKKEVKLLREKKLELTENIGIDPNADEEINKIDTRLGKLRSEIRGITGELEQEKNQLVDTRSQLGTSNLLQGISKHSRLLQEVQESEKDGEKQLKQARENSHNSSDSPAKSQEVAEPTIDVSVKSVSED